MIYRWGVALWLAAASVLAALAGVEGMMAEGYAPGARWQTAWSAVEAVVLAKVVGALVAGWLMAGFLEGGARDRLGLRPLVAVIFVAAASGASGAAGSMVSALLEDGNIAAASGLAMIGAATALVLMAASPGASAVWTVAWAGLWWAGVRRRRLRAAREASCLTAQEEASGPIIPLV